MEKKVILLGALLLTAHGLAVINTWYWLYPSIDIPMHLLGGAFVATFFLWLTEKYPGQWQVSRNFFVRATIFLSFTALVGVLWEFSEFIYGFFASYRAWHIAGGDVTDTVTDLLNDLLGGLAVVVVDCLRYNKLNRSHE